MTRTNTETISVFPCTPWLFRSPCNPWLEVLCRPRLPVSIGGFPEWFNALGQKPWLGPFPFALVLFVVLLIVAAIVLQRSAFGRYTYVIGNNANVARYSGISVRANKMWLFMASGFIAALAGVLLAAPS